MGEGGSRSSSRRKTMNTCLICSREFVSTRARGNHHRRSHIGIPMPDYYPITPTKLCSRCGSEYAPTLAQFRKHSFQCPSCKNEEFRRDYHERGRRGGIKTPEQRAAYEKVYQARPEVRRARAQRMAAYVRDPRQRHRHEARWLLRRAVRRGDIARGPCELCGTTVNVHGHHDDYTKPLEVRWLCVSHHNSFHKAAARGETERVR